jgi:hypothetical protein
VDRVGFTEATKPAPLHHCRASDLLQRHAGRVDAEQERDVQRDAPHLPPFDIAMEGFTSRNR